MRLTVLLFLLPFFIWSCGTNKTNNFKSTSSKPKWIYGVYNKNKICGVGISNIHVRGEAYQRATAISRAIDEIARQMNVKVNTSLEYFMSKNGSSALQVYSFQTTNGQTVKAKIEDVYVEPKSKRLYILMCAY